MSSRYCKIALLLSSLLLLGFEWQGRLTRLRQELEGADAARRREVVRMLASYPADAVRESLLQALSDPDAGVRAEAAEAVGRVRLREAVPRLLDWLDDPDADVRASAALALGRIGAARAVPPLVRLLGDSRADVRRAAVTALESIGTPEVVVPLLGRLDDADTTVRIAAIEALARLGDPQAIVPLVGQLRDDAPEVRQAVYAALGRLGSPRAVPGLLQGLTDRSLDARLIAIGALGRLGAAEAVPALVSLADEPDHRVARAAIAALGAIGGDRATAAIVASLGRNETRETATSVLVQMARRQRAGPDASEAPSLAQRLADALSKSRDDARATAIAQALVRVSDVRSIGTAAPALLEALGDGRGEPRVLMKAIGASGSPRALVPLLENLRAGETEVQQAALVGLDLLFDRIPPDGRAADPLLAALGRLPSENRPRVVRLLGEVGAQRAVPTLRGLLDTDDAELRLAAVEALGAIGDPEGASALLPLLEDPDGRTRFEAARALGAAATAQTVNELADRLVAPEPRDRHAILRAMGAALGRLREEGRVPDALARTVRDRLEGLLRGRDRRLAARAVDAVARWGDPGQIGLLARLAGTGPPALRRQALRALGAIDAPASRRALRRALADADDPRLASVAAAALGERGGADDVPRLMAAVDEGRFPLPAAAAFGLARLVRRGAAGEPDTERLCALAQQSRDAHVRANLAVALAALEGARCPDGPDPAHWLESRHAPAVRAAAARWLAAQGEAGHAPAARVERALEACAQGDPDPAVVRACTDPAQPPLDSTADVYAYNADGSELLTDRLIALRLADGTVWVTHADLNGHVFLREVPSGPLVLEDPLSVPLER